jgi:hypothetical protein
MAGSSKEGLLFLKRPRKKHFSDPATGAATSRLQRKAKVFAPLFSKSGYLLASLCLPLATRSL